MLQRERRLRIDLQDQLEEAREFGLGLGLGLGVETSEEKWSQKNGPSFTLSSDWTASEA